jgi:hypothetical protein
MGPATQRDDDGRRSRWTSYEGERWWLSAFALKALIDGDWWWN